MIQITPQMRIFLAVEPVDFRQGIDGLAGVCRRALGSDPLQGTLFVFRSRSRRALKLLVYDGQGFWLCQKRLSSGRFEWWPAARAGTTHALLPLALQTLLWNGDPTAGRAAPLWRPVALAAAAGPPEK